MRQRGLARALVVAALVLAAAAMLYAAWHAFRPGSSQERPPRAAAVDEIAPLSVAELLGGAPVEGFRRADEPRTFAFPEDHGPHDGFRTEWWYFTGNLEDGAGRRFGFQLTFFRNALDPRARERESRWGTHVVWMAHFAVTDAGSGRLVEFERFEREALGLAGARAGGLDLNVGDWSARPDEGRLRSGWRLVADGDTRTDAARAGNGVNESPRDGGAAAIDLTVRPIKPVVLQGKDGLSVKGAERGNASYYYSMTRLAAEGRVRFGDASYEVSGLAWLDREWSTSALGEGQEGWDWFALQLDDGSELMLYRLRRAGGETDRHSAGSFSPPLPAAKDGPDTSGAPGNAADPRAVADEGARATAVPIDAASFRIAENASWESPRGGTYPAAWTVEVPSLELFLDVTPIVSDQELDLSIRYWEGAVDVRGRRDGVPVGGQGYVELTGYAAR